MLWNRERVPPAVRALGLILLAGSLSGFLAAIFRVAPDSPVGLFRLVGVVAFAGAVLLWWLGDRTPHWLLHATVAGGTVLISVLIARAATAVGMVVTATDYMWMGVYAGFFFSRSATRAHLTLIAITFGAALLINTHWVPVDAWIFMTASVVVASETIAPAELAPAPRGPRPTSSPACSTARD